VRVRNPMTPRHRRHKENDRCTPHVCSAMEMTGAPLRARAQGRPPHPLPFLLLLPPLSEMKNTKRHSLRITRPRLAIYHLRRNLLLPAPTAVGAARARGRRLAATCMSGSAWVGGRTSSRSTTLRRICDGRRRCRNTILIAQHTCCEGSAKNGERKSTHRSAAAPPKTPPPLRA
jgi:hypothetical protein